MRAVRRYNEGSWEGREGGSADDDDDESQFSPNERVTDRVVERY